MNTRFFIKATREAFLLLLGTLLFINLYATGESCCCGIDSEIEVPGGDFEFAPFPAPGGWIDGIAPNFIGPWEVVFGSVSHHDDGHNNLGAGNPNPSTAHMDLNGFNVGGICQDIGGFTVGVEYSLSFFYAVHNAVPNATAIVEIDGGDALDEEWTANNHGQDEWLEACYGFIATSTNMSLCFLSEGGAACCGMLIDDIVIFSCNIDAELPVINNPPADMVFQCLDEVTDPITLDVTDNCDGDIEIEFAEDINDDEPCMVLINRVWTLTDVCGNQLDYLQQIIVSDMEAPIIEDPPIDLTLECLEDLEDDLEDWIEDLADANVTDNCAEIELIIDESQINFDNCGVYPLELVFIDECGNMTNSISQVVIDDPLAPEFIDLPEDLIISCDDDKEDLIEDWLDDFGEAEVFDYCDVDLSIIYDENCDTDQEVTFIAQDLCGNISSATANILINLDTLIYLIDTFTCDPDHPEVIEIFSPSLESCDTLTIYEFEKLSADTMVIDSIWCDGIDSFLDTTYLYNLAGCDSLIIYNIMAVSLDTTLIADSTCDIDEVGVDTIYENSVFGCDSIIIVQTEFNLNDTIISVEYICDLESFEEEIIVVPGSFCDSVFVFQSVPLQSDSIVINDFSCSALDTGAFVFFDTNLSGCDSTSYLYVSYQPIGPIFFDTYTCDASELSVDTTISVNGVCDTIFVEQIFLSASDTTIMDFETCMIDIPNDTTWLLNEAGCDSLVINQYNYVPLIFDYDIISDPCNGDDLSSIEYFNVSGGNEPYLYALDGLDFVSTPFFDQLNAGMYTLTVQDADGCMSSAILVELVSTESVELLLDSELTIIDGTPGQISFQIIGDYDQFYWSDASVLSCDDCLDPMVTITEDITLTLTVADLNGCLVSQDILLLFDELIVEEEPDDLFILVPNVFSPNGDGLNDEFIIFNSPGITILSLRVFNRWGDEVFVVQPTAEQTVSWDGRFNGRSLNPDVFVYQIMYIDGELREQKLFGDVTLIQ